MKVDISERKLLCNHLPESFSGVRVLQISDLHNRCFGKEQSYLLEVTRKTNPDYIFVTGDLIDEHHRRIDGVIQYLSGAIRIAPIFYVSGNHEWTAKGQYSKLLKHIETMGVIVLQDEIIELERGGDRLQLIGMDDPYKLPGVGGVLAPHQGFFPQYTEGVIVRNGTTMVVSRGLGDGIVPFRINNRPEVVVTLLESV